ncbi:MAG: ATP-binding protein [Candidatus Cryptobacteroides sp.]
MPPLEIPQKGIREILYNSIAHKSYDGPDIQMKVYYDKINLWNYGALPTGYTFDAMFKEHKSMPRNKLIANAFYYAGFVEAWGRGFEIIEESFKKEGLQVPTFREEFQGVTVEIKRERFLAMRGNVTAKVILNNTMNLSERQKVILNLLPKDVTVNVTANVTVNSETMASKLGVTSRTIKRDLKTLQEAGMIRRVGSDKTGYWVVITRQ